MPAHVAHNPAILTMLVSSTSATGRASDQSIPVDARRCTFSTQSDQNTIGKPQAATATRAESGPSARSGQPGKPRPFIIAPKLRATTIASANPASPANPTAELTADIGRGSCGAVSGCVTATAPSANWLRKRLPCQQRQSRPCRASKRRRRALSLMKPAASFWS